MDNKILKQQIRITNTIGINILDMHFAISFSFQDCLFLILCL